MAEVEKMTLSVSFEEKWEFLATFWINKAEILLPSGGAEVVGSFLAL